MDVVDSHSPSLTLRGTRVAQYHRARGLDRSLISIWFFSRHQEKGPVGRPRQATGSVPRCEDEADCSGGNEWSSSLSGALEQRYLVTSRQSQKKA